MNNKNEIDNAYEQAARIVEQSFKCVAHSIEERIRVEVVNDLARQIRALKSAQPNRTRKLQSVEMVSDQPLTQMPKTCMIWGCNDAPLNPVKGFMVCSNCGASYGSKAYFKITERKEVMPKTATLTQRTRENCEKLLAESLVVKDIKEQNE